MPTTSAHSRHAPHATLSAARRGLRMGRWFARPEPRAALVAGPVDADADDGDNDHAAHGGWHASSLDLAAGLRVCEVNCAREAEELMRRHFGPLSATTAAH